MASGIPGRKLGYEGSGGGGGGGNLFKRTLADMERQLQNALLLRSVRQRTQTMPSIFSFSYGVGGLVCNSFTAAEPQRLVSSLPSASSSEFGLPRKPELLLVSSVPEDRSPVSVSDQLRELERQLLLDDEDEAEASVSCGSAATHAEAIQRLISPPPLLASPTNSSSSTISFASCSPPSSMPSPPLPPSSRQMLLDTATALGEGNLDAATANLTLLKRAADTRGDAEHRLMAVMVTALLSRLNHPQVGISHPIADLRSPEHFAATQMLYSLSPCFKLGFVTANSAILDATKDEPKIHILDFEVGQGGQYAALIQTVAERLRLRPAKSPPAIRITAIIDPSSPFTNINAGNLRAVGDRIKKLAERFRVVLHFNIVSLRVAELGAASLGCETGEETLVVNLPFVLSRVPDESVSPENPRDELLRRVCALRPRLVAIAEQEINTSTAPFPARLAEACRHYGALLESLEAAAQDSSGPERGRVEAGLARRAVNAVAGEGAERVERCEVLGKWRARMSMAGFEPVPLGPTVVESIKARLASSWPNPGFTVKEDAGSLALGFAWMNRVLTVASAWR
ncbi:unnamed protein product [Musa acuminata subsp. malaccensis]|uniref:(wild Malaysian banana) hypothetical protein n=1 Tax=Musa acuminata subsp. malaccensis TaxID=214687 RepID=A0A804KLH3_MUSAM|nr:PREDICTED: scarecrow-like protein 8 [Musa acuminata subsp. malaccensis]CAG1835747.1 unnamed protein product [Musa acuminata subsp. malaccensis]